MAYSITQFENNLTNSLVALDNNFITFGALVPIPCSVAGQNTLTLTPNAAGLVPTPTISVYTTDMIFSGIAAQSNNGAVTATVGSVGALPVYKDGPGGPVVLSGSEIIGLCAFSLRYDAALNAGNGGFHLISTTAGNQTALSQSSIQIGATSGNATITNMLSGAAALTFTATPGWLSQDQFFTLTGPAGQPALLPAPGDFVQVSPPSLAANGVTFWGQCTALASLNSTSSVATMSIRLVNAASASLASNSGSYRWVATRMVP
jgi:hypothetical protein